MTDIVIPYSPRPLQRELHKALDTKRFALIVAHRRFGKTVAMINQLVRDVMTADPKERPRPRGAYIAPLLRQAKQVAWDYLKHYTRPIPGMSFNEAELRADFPTGARIQLFGADNPDSLRGIYLDACCLDEPAQMPPKLWGEIIRPCLADRKGKAYWIGTPQGRNLFWDQYQMALGSDEWHTAVYRASETGILDDSELSAMRAELSPEEYAQELECSWSAAIKGAYYASYMDQAERDGRIGVVPVDPMVKVHTAWDLGVDDATAVWFVQRVGDEIRLVDYLEGTGQGLEHYALELQAKGYLYGDHIVPHDVEVRELGTGKSRRDVLAGLGIRVTVAPKLAVTDGINAVRSILHKCRFDAGRCESGINALRQYRVDYNERLGVNQQRPLHDWTSHAADAMRYLAVSEKRLTNDDWGDDLNYDLRWVI